MDLFLAQLLNGCALGALYGLFGIGFGLVFATMGILNAAQGAYASWAAIIAMYAIELAGLPFPLAALAGIAAGGAVAVLVDQLGFEPLRRFGPGNHQAAMLGALITSIAFWIMLDSAAGLMTGQQSLAFPPGSYPATVFQIGPLLLPAMQAVSLLALAVVGGGMHWLNTRTRFGAAMRAVGWDPVAAALGGVNSRVIVVATAGLAGGISGLAGILAGISTANISAGLGQGLMLKGFAAVVVGGYDDIRGTALAGLLLGVLEVFCAQYLSSSWRDAFAYALLLGFLMLRPRGLFGGGGFTRA
jgi:branched-chain amino acid transport system permease protein